MQPPKRPPANVVSSHVRINRPPVNVLQTSCPYFVANGHSNALQIHPNQGIQPSIYDQPHKMNPFSNDTTARKHACIHIVCVRTCQGNSLSHQVLKSYILYII